MTINATAAWLWGLYLALAEEQGVDPAVLAGTTQNDIVKEYLSRGTHIFAPEPSRRLIVDMIAYGINHAPKWNPVNVCSYHLQEAGATPVQEVAFALATAVDILDAVRDPATGATVGRIVNAPRSSIDGVEIVYEGTPSALNTRALTQALLVATAFAALTQAYVTSDFSVANVAANSHSAKPLLYKITGVWGNHEGSMLLWVLILALFGATLVALLWIGVGR